MTGRFQLIRVFHWNSHESRTGYDLSFDEHLRYGGYPGSYPFIKTKNWASFVKQSIVATVIEKDILQYQNVKSPALFKQAFELLVGAELCRIEGDLYYWREGAFEVDFVLKIGKKIYAIEVKSGRRRDKKGLLKFKEKNPTSKIVLITEENYASFEKAPMAFLDSA